MTLECTILILDNSAYSINGDFPPTRLAAQADAVHIIFNNKLRANPENEVGLMVMAGKGAEVLVTPTQDEGKLIAALHQTKQGGESDLNTGIQVAQLALKHRQNKNQRQRIIVFVGSPISASAALLVKLGKKMKKNNVAIDIISFGNDFDPASLPSLLPSSSTAEPIEIETNASKLAALHEAVNSSDNSHLITIEPGPHLLSERIAASAILRGDADEGGNGGGGGGDEFGVDPNMDPELAEALRMSLEEERARQAALASASAAAALPVVPEGGSIEAALSAAPSTVDAFSTPIKREAPTEATGLLSSMDEDENDDLAKALAMSRGDDIEMGNAEEDDEEAEIARAIAMSMRDDEEVKKEGE